MSTDDPTDATPAPQSRRSGFSEAWEPVAFHQGRETRLQTADGVSLYVDVHPGTHDGPPETAKTMVFVHGVGDHGRRYQHVAHHLERDGWRVIIPDMRGHGRSTGRQVFVNSFDEYLGDLDLLWQQFQLDPQRTVLMGHSMGGLIAARYAQTRPKRMRAVVMASPFLGLKIKLAPWYVSVGRILGKVIPWLRVPNHIRAEDLSHSEDARLARKHDNELRRFVTLGWFFASLQAIDKAWDAVDDIQTPTLVMQGTGDHIVDPQATYEWFQQVDATKDLLLRKESLHELLNETDWLDVVLLMENWLNKQFSQNAASPAE